MKVIGEEIESDVLLLDLVNSFCLLTVCKEKSVKVKFNISNLTSQNAKMSIHERLLTKGSIFPLLYPQIIVLQSLSDNIRHVLPYIHSFQKRNKGTC